MQEVETPKAVSSQVKISPFTRMDSCRPLHSECESAAFRSGPKSNSWFVLSAGNVARLGNVSARTETDALLQRCNIRIDQAALMYSSRCGKLAFDAAGINWTERWGGADWSDCPDSQGSAHAAAIPHPRSVTTPRRMPQAVAEVRRPSVCSRQDD